MLTSESSGILPQSNGGVSRPRGLSPAGRLCAFVLLAALLFVVARQVGHDLGPIGTSHARSVVAPHGRSGGGMNMNMGSGTVRLKTARGDSTLR
jgi:hypothetical protein